MAISIVTLVAFVFNIVSYDLAWAASQPKVSPDLTLSVTLPAYFGYIKHQFKGSSDKLVIHIQDAHCNYNAQNAIAGIISYLNSTYEIRAVNLEGGEGDYDFSPFSDLEGESAKRDAADRIMRAGELNGAEFYAVNNPGAVKLWGVEDTDLYLDNLKIYRDSLKYRDSVQAALGELGRRLASLKAKLYSKEMLDLDVRSTAFRDKAENVKDYIPFLAATAKSSGIDISGLKNLNILQRSALLEKGINFKRANDERDALISRLEKSLSRKELKELVEKTVEFKMERMTGIEFYAYLAAKAKDVNIEISEYRDLVLYIGYVGIYATLKKEDLFAEISGLEESITEKLSPNEKVRKLADISKKVTLIRNMLNITFTPDEFAYYTAHRRNFDMDEIIRFVESESARLGTGFTLGEDALHLGERIKETEEFYALGQKRDREFVKRMKFERAKGAKAAIIITGGFHTENLMCLLKKKNISYISVMPNFGIDEVECPYFKLLAGNSSIFQKHTPAAASNLALYTHFGEKSAEVYGPEEDVKGVVDGLLKVPAAVASLPAAILTSVAPREPAQTALPASEAQSPRAAATPQPSGGKLPYAIAISAATLSLFNTLVDQLSNLDFILYVAIPLVIPALLHELIHYIVGKKTEGVYKLRIDLSKASIGIWTYYKRGTPNAAKKQFRISVFPAIFNIAAWLVARLITPAAADIDPLLGLASLMFAYGNALCVGLSILFDIPISLKLLFSGAYRKKFQAEVDNGELMAPEDKKADALTNPPPAAQPVAPEAPAAQAADMQKMMSEWKEIYVMDYGAKGLRGFLEAIRWKFYQHVVNPLKHRLTGKIYEYVITRTLKTYDKRFGGKRLIKLIKAKVSANKAAGSATNYLDACGGMGCAATEAAIKYGVNSFVVDLKEYSLDDLSEKEIESARKSGKEDGVEDILSRQFRFIRSDITDRALPAKVGEKMDVITMFAALQFNKDPLQAIVNCYNMLKKGGVLMTVYPEAPLRHKEALDAFYEFLRQLVLMGAKVDCRTYLDKPDESYNLIIDIQKTNDISIDLGSPEREVIPTESTADGLTSYVVYYRSPIKITEVSTPIVPQPPLAAPQPASGETKPAAWFVTKKGWYERRHAWWAETTVSIAAASVIAYLFGIPLDDYFAIGGMSGFIFGIMHGLAFIQALLTPKDIRGPPMEEAFSRFFNPRMWGLALCKFILGSLAGTCGISDWSTVSFAVILTALHIVNNLIEYPISTSTQSAAAPAASISVPDGAKNGPVQTLEGAVLDKLIKKVMAQKTARWWTRGDHLTLLREGKRIFNGYSPYLNQHGHAVRKEFDRAFNRARERKLDWKKEFGRLKKLFAEIPTVENPQCGLFIDVFPEMTDGQLKAICAIGKNEGAKEKGLLNYQNSVAFKVTKNCSNKCLTCLALAPCGQPFSVPFPIVVKVIQRLVKATDVFMPYFDSEPADYHDKVIGAGLSDIVSAAHKAGFSYFDVCIVTHGSEYRGEEAVDNIRKTASMVFPSLSFHVNKHDVFHYAVQKVDGVLAPDKAKKIRRDLVSKYTQRFIPLIKAISYSGRYSIRRYENAPLLAELFSPDGYEKAVEERTGRKRNLSSKERAALARANAVIKEIEAVQNEVWGKILEKENIPRDHVEDRYIIWCGRAAVLLKNLGVPEDMIRFIQEYLPSLLSSGIDPYSISFEADGSISLVISENDGFASRPAGELFKDHNSAEFISFIKLLGLVLEKGTVSQGGVGIRNRWLNELALPEIKSFLRSKNVLCNGLREDDITLYAQINRNYLSYCLDAETDALLRQSLERRLDDQELQWLYEKLRDTPFPQTILFEVVITGEHFRESDEFETLKPLLWLGRDLEGYKFAMPFTRQPAQRNVFKFLTLFKLKERVFIPSGNSDIAAAWFVTKGRSYERKWAWLETPASIAAGFGIAYIFGLPLDDYFTIGGISGLFFGMMHGIAFIQTLLTPKDIRGPPIAEATNRFFNIRMWAIALSKAALGYLAGTYGILDWSTISVAIIITTWHAVHSLRTYPLNRNIKTTDPNEHDPDNYSYLLHTGVGRTDWNSPRFLGFLFENLDNAAVLPFCTYWNLKDSKEKDNRTGLWSTAEAALIIDPSEAELFWCGSVGERREEIFFPLRGEPGSLNEYAKNIQREIARWRGKDSGRYRDLSSYPDWPSEEKNPLEVDVIGGKVAGVYLRDLSFRPGMAKPSTAFHFIALALKYNKPIVLDSVEDERIFETMILSDEFTAVLGKREMLSAEHDVRYWREKARQLARPGRLAAARSASPPADQASYITAFSDEGVLGGRNAAVAVNADGLKDCAAFKKLVEEKDPDFTKLLDSLEQGSAILAGLKRNGLGSLYFKDMIGRMVTKAAQKARNDRTLLDELVKRMLGLKDLNSRRLLCCVVLGIGDHTAVMDSAVRLAGIDSFNFNAGADISGGNFREGALCGEAARAMPGFNALFRNRRNLANLARLAAALRMIYAYDLALPVKDGGSRIGCPPLEFAYQKDRDGRKNIAIRLFQGEGTTLWLTPVTGSFRRSVIFATDNKTGSVGYSVEMKMDGELETKRSLPLNAIALEEDLKGIYGEGYDDIMHPIAEITLGEGDLPKGFMLYNQPRDRLNVMLIEHDPKAVRLIYGKRAPALRPEVCRRNAVEALKILLKFQMAGYVGSADSRPGNDVHPENFLMSSAYRWHRVRQVCDVADFVKETPENEFQFYADITSSAQGLARIEAAAMMLDDDGTAKFIAQNAGELEAAAMAELRGDLETVGRQDLLDGLARHAARLERLGAAAEYITDRLKPLPAAAADEVSGDTSSSNVFRDILREIVDWNIKLTGEDRFYGKKMPLVVMGTVKGGLFAVDTKRRTIVVDRGLTGRREDPKWNIALKIGLMDALFAEAGVDDSSRYGLTVLFINSLLREAEMPADTFVAALKGEGTRPAPHPRRTPSGAINGEETLPAERPTGTEPAEDENDTARKSALRAAKLLTGREGNVYRAGSRVFEINGRRIESQEILCGKPDDFRFYHIGPLAFIMPYDGFRSMEPAPSQSDVLRRVTESAVGRVGETLEKGFGESYEGIRKSLILAPPSHELPLEPLNGFTEGMIAQMIGNAADFNGARVIYAGAGGGILASVALRLGAGQVILIERDARSRDWAKLFLKANGYTEGVHFTIMNRDLADETLAGDIRNMPLKAGQKVIGLANIGPWREIYGKANEKALKLFTDLGAQLFFNGGYSFTELGHRENFDGMQADLRERRNYIVEVFDYRSGRNHCGILIARLAEPIPAATAPETAFGNKPTADILESLSEARASGDEDRELQILNSWCSIPPEGDPNEHYASVQGLIDAFIRRIQNNEELTVGFVCSGNANRSANADILMKDALRKRGLDKVTVQSAGTATAINYLVGKPLSEPMREELASTGIPVDRDIVDSFRSSQLTADFIRKSDLIIVAEPRHARRVILEALLDGQDDPSGKIVLMTELQEELLRQYGREFPDWGHTGNAALADIVNRAVSRLVAHAPSAGNGGNVTCGTICEAGHEGSYNALDEQLRRTFGRYKASLGIAWGRDITEKEADTAVTKESSLVKDPNQLDEIRKWVREKGDIPDHISIFFGIPEGDSRLWRVNNDYAGGHFNKAGTRIHISLPLILGEKDPKQAALVIALHEKAHIEGKPHDANDAGMRLAMRIATIPVARGRSMTRRNLFKAIAAGTALVLLKRHGSVLVEDKNTGDIILFFMAHDSAKDFARVEPKLTEAIKRLRSRGKTVHYFVEGNGLESQFNAALVLYEALDPSMANALTDIFPDIRFSKDLKDLREYLDYLIREGEYLFPKFELLDSIYGSERYAKYDESMRKKHARAAAVVSEMKKLYGEYRAITDGKVLKGAAWQKALQRIEKVFKAHCDAVEDAYNKGIPLPLPCRLINICDRFWAAQADFLKKMDRTGVIVHVEHLTSPYLLNKYINLHDAIKTFFDPQWHRRWPDPPAMDDEELGRQPYHLPAILFLGRGDALVNRSRIKKTARSVRDDKSAQGRIDRCADYLFELMREWWRVVMENRDNALSRQVAETCRGEGDVCVMTRGEMHYHELPARIASLTRNVPETIVMRDDLSNFILKDRAFLLRHAGVPTRRMARRYETMIAGAMARYLYRQGAFMAGIAKSEDAELDKVYASMMKKAFWNRDWYRTFLVDALKAYDVYNEVVADALKNGDELGGRYDRHSVYSILFAMNTALEKHGILSDKSRIRHILETGITYKEERPEVRERVNAIVRKFDARMRGAAKKTVAATPAQQVTVAAVLPTLPAPAGAAEKGHGVKGGGGKLRHTNLSTWNGDLPKERFGASVNLFSVVEEALMQTFDGKVPLYALYGSAVYLVREDGAPDWDAVSDIDIMVFGDFKKVVSAKKRIGELLQQRGLKVGGIEDSPEYRLECEDGNRYGVTVVAGNMEDLFSSSSADISNYCLLYTYKGDVEPLNAELARHGTERIADHNTQIYYEWMKYVRGIGVLKDLKILCRMACLRGIQDSDTYRQLLYVYKKLAKQYPHEAWKSGLEGGDQALYRKAYDAACAKWDATREIVRDDIARTAGRVLSVSAPAAEVDRILAAEIDYKTIEECLFPTLTPADEKVVVERLESIRTSVRRTPSLQAGDVVKAEIAYEQRKYHEVFDKYRAAYESSKRSFVNSIAEYRRLSSAASPEGGKAGLEAGLRAVMESRRALVEAIARIVFYNQLLLRPKYFYKMENDRIVTVPDKESRRYSLTTATLDKLMELAELKEGEVVVDMFAGPGNLLTYLSTDTRLKKVIAGDLKYGYPEADGQETYAIEKNLEELKELFNFLPDTLRPDFRDITTLKHDATHTPSIPDTSADKVFVDPPYGREGDANQESYEQDAFLLFLRSARESYRILRGGGKAFCVMPGEWSSFLEWAVAQGGVLGKIEPRDLSNKFYELTSHSPYYKITNRPYGNRYDEKGWNEVKDILLAIVANRTACDFKTAEQRLTFFFPLSIATLTKIAPTGPPISVPQATASLASQPITSAPAAEVETLIAELRRMAEERRRIVAQADEVVGKLNQGVAISELAADEKNLKPRDMAISAEMASAARAIGEHRESARDVAPLIAGIINDGLMVMNEGEAFYVPHCEHGPGKDMLTAMCEALGNIGIMDADTVRALWKGANCLLEDNISTAAKEALSKLKSRPGFDSTLMPIVKENAIGKEQRSILAGLGITPPAPSAGTAKDTQIEHTIREIDEIREMRGRINHTEYIDKHAIRDWLLRLELLSQMGIGGRTLYINMGEDFFPSYFWPLIRVDPADESDPNKKGVGQKATILDLLKREADRLGLPDEYKNRETNAIETVREDAFETDRYLGRIKAGGSPNVVLIKGLGPWGEGGYQAAEHETSKTKIKELVGRIANELLSPGGYIVIADHRNMWLADYIEKELGFTDFLKEHPDAEACLSKDTAGTDIDFRRQKVVLGAVPIRVFRKTTSAPAAGVAGEVSSVIQGRLVIQNDGTELTLTPTSNGKDVFKFLVSDISKNGAISQRTPEEDYKTRIDAIAEYCHLSHNEIQDHIKTEDKDISLCDLTMTHNYLRNAWVVLKFFLMGKERFRGWLRQNPPVIIEWGRNSFISEGNHRCIAAWLMGEDSIPARVIRISDPETAAVFEKNIRPELNAKGCSLKEGEAWFINWLTAQQRPTTVSSTGQAAVQDKSERDKIAFDSISAIRELTSPVGVVIPVMIADGAEGVSNEQKFKVLAQDLQKIFTNSRITFYKVGKTDAETAANYEEAYGRVTGQIAKGAPVISYAPASIRSVIDASRRVITDAMADALSPDMRVRIALAYHLSYYLRHPDDGYAKNEIIKLLQATADPGEAEKIKKDLEEDLTNIFRDFVLKIRPVNWESFAEYIRAQKVISESA